jgi:hypothetical protein
MQFTSPVNEAEWLRLIRNADGLNTISPNLVTGDNKRFPGAAFSSAKAYRWSWRLYSILCSLRGPEVLKSTIPYVLSLNRTNVSRFPLIVQLELCPGTEIAADCTRLALVSIVPGGKNGIAFLVCFPE